MTDVATACLRDRILDLTFAPGEQLEEKKLLERFQLSRTPVREAINRLIAEGLVEIRNNRGAYVSSMDLEDVIALLDAYVLSERMVVSVCKLEHPGLVEDLKCLQKKFVTAVDEADLLMITEANARFHGRIAEATQNRFIVNYSADLHNLARRTSFYIYRREKMETGRSKIPAERINRHHEQIIRFVDERNRERLIDVATGHAVMFRERMEALLHGPNPEDIDFCTPV